MNPRALKRGSRAVYVFLAVAIPLLGGCLERELKPLNPCLVSGVVAEIAVTNVDKIDLLFMVDNSQSMEQEQEALRLQFPRLINILTSGDKNADGVQDFPPAKDLHLGVVSSDLGLPGLEGVVENCNLLGDEGRLLNTANAELAAMAGMCSATTYNPPFLAYNRENMDDPARLANDFSCIATLGIDGCGFEQQLESMLKAVWPGADESVTFVTDPAGFGMFGMAGPGFPNGEFIRNNPNEGPSLIALVLVSDEEDCSSRRMDHFVPGASPNGLNTRCYFEGLRGAESNLFQVNRYIDLFKLLRPGQENLVIFAGIVGVPQRLTTEDVLANYDFDVPGQSEAYMDMILGAEEMIEMVNDMGTPDVPEDDGIRPSCDRGPMARAYPPRRIVEVAKGFGSNGVIASICQEDFTPAINAIIDVIAKQLGTVCLPRPLVRNSDGLVGCNVVWELPPQPVGGAPTRCDERSFLLPPDPGRETIGANRGNVCKVAQLAVADLSTPDPVTGDTKGPIATMNGDILANQGWYYDEFSMATQTECTGAMNKQRITFTPEAQPPTGVTVKLECLNETQSLANTRTDVVPNRPGYTQATIGSPCEMVQRNNEVLMGDAACVVQLANPDDDGNREDRSMFCHEDFKVCVLGCSTDAECPAAWVCDDRPESKESAGMDRAYCTNPTCGSE
jgi:hypothetical protein